MVLSIVFTLLIIGIDRVVKIWAQNSLSQVGSIDVIKNVFSLTYVQNTGGAFSILKEHTWILTALSALFCCVLFYFIFIKKVNRKYIIPLSFILAGGIGNLIDRILYGYVIDLFNIYIINHPIFNVADIFITFGGIIFVILFIYYDIIKAKKE